MNRAALDIAVTTRRRRFWLARPLGLLCRVGLRRPALVIACRFVRVDAYINGHLILSVPFRETFDTEEL